MPGVADETKMAMVTGQHAIVDADKRYLAKGVWGLSGPEIQAIRKMLTLADELLKRANNAEVRRLIAWVWAQNEQTSVVLGSAAEPLRHAA